MVSLLALKPEGSFFAFNSFAFLFGIPVYTRDAHFTFVRTHASSLLACFFARSFPARPFRSLDRMYRISTVLSRIHPRNWVHNRRFTKCHLLAWLADVCPHFSLHSMLGHLGARQVMPVPMGRDEGNRFF